MITNIPIPIPRFWVKFVIVKLSIPKNKILIAHEVYMTSEIEEMLHNLCELYNVALEIDVFYDGATLVDYIEMGTNYDIIYLDIEMKQNGVEAARRIRKMDTNVLIIYVTSHESFAKEVFEVSAYRFITKPIDKKIFEKYFLSAIETVRSVPVYYRYSILLLLIPIGSMYVVYNLFILSGTSKDQMHISLIGLGIMLLINVIIFRVILKLSEESELRRENTVYAQQLELCNNHMTEKESVMLEFRNARHDMKHHFIVMMKMIEMKEFSDLSEYLSKLIQENKYEKLGVSRTDNIVIDALINAKYIYAEKNGIHFDIQINVPIQLPFENADISILLGNILDNAFEASIQLPVNKRNVELIMRLDNNMLIVVSKNQYCGILIKDKNGRLATTKGDAQNHGIGLKSVYRITNKYHGSVVIDDSDNMFIIKILLCNI